MPTLGQSLEVLTNGFAKLTFDAIGYSATNVVVQSAGALASPIPWADEQSAVITTNAVGNFEVQLPQQGSIRFYRIKASQ